MTRPHFCRDCLSIYMSKVKTHLFCAVCNIFQSHLLFLFCFLLQVHITCFAGASAKVLPNADVCVYTGKLIYIHFLYIREKIKEVIQRDIQALSGTFTIKTVFKTLLKVHECNIGILSWFMNIGNAC